jgi:transposase-like protein
VEFKTGAVRVGLDEGKTVVAVARELDLAPSALALWGRQTQAERTKGKSGLMREELARPRKENRGLRMERDILKRRRPSSPSTSSDLRDDRRGEGPLSRAGVVSDAGRVAQRVLCLAHAPESKRAQEVRRLKILLHASFAGGRGCYGSPRIQDDFIGWGKQVSRKRIIRLNQKEGLIARVVKRHKVNTDSDHDHRIADNVLRQDFTAQAPNQRWVGDTTELRLGDQGDA